MHKQSLNVTVFMFDDIALLYVEGEDRMLMIFGVSKRPALITHPACLDSLCVYFQIISIE